MRGAKHAPHTTALAPKSAEAYQMEQHPGDACRSAADGTANNIKAKQHPGN